MFILMREFEHVSVCERSLFLQARRLVRFAYAAGSRVFALGTVVVCVSSNG